jgi:hypothetical protein
MIVLCAWCKTEMGNKPGYLGMISHGICPACLVEYRKEFEVDVTAAATKQELAEYGIAVAAPVETAIEKLAVARKPVHGTGIVLALLLVIPLWAAIGLIIWKVMR